MGRNYSAADQLLMRLSRGLGRAAPAPAKTDAAEAARLHSAGLMRVNHAGEVAAQALYRGQALTARNPETRRHLLAAAAEETAHLRWCEERLQELDAKPSRLQPLWHAGSYAIGALAGLAGDKLSLGFVHETEKQVAEHLGEHLQNLPASDVRSREILQKMREDETRHGAEAQAAGGQALPAPVRGLMRGVARIMKIGAYRF